MYQLFNFAWCMNLVPHIINLCIYYLCISGHVLFIFYLYTLFFYFFILIANENKSLGDMVSYEKMVLSPSTKNRSILLFWDVYEKQPRFYKWKVSLIRHPFFPFSLILYLLFCISLLLHTFSPSLLLYQISH